MKKYVVLAAFLAVTGLMLFRFLQPVPTRVALLGDSLTVQMQKMAPLTAARRDLQLVGITREHTIAFGGFTCQNLDHVLSTVPSPPADVVLLMIGTNDLLRGEPNTDRFADLLNTVRAVWPKARVIVAPVLPANGPRIGEAARRDWNDRTAKIAAYHGAEVLPDLKLDQADYDADTIHLSKSGYGKMRDRWLAALLPARDQ